MKFSNLALFGASQQLVIGYNNNDNNNNNNNIIRPSLEALLAHLSLCMFIIYLINKYKMFVVVVVVVALLDFSLSLRV